MSNKLLYERDMAIIELVKKGHTFREIAATYNMSHQRVHQIYTKYTTIRDVTTHV